MARWIDWFIDRWTDGYFALDQLSLDDLVILLILFLSFLLVFQGFVSHAMAQEQHGRGDIPGWEVLDLRQARGMGARGNWSKLFSAAVSPRHFLDFGIQFGPKFEPQANQLVNVSKHTVRSTDDDDDDDDDDEDNNNSNYYYFFKSHIVLLFLLLLLFIIHIVAVW